MRKTIATAILGLAMATVNALEIRFDDATDSYSGERYRYVGDGPIRLTIPALPRPDQPLVFRWGAKNDVRTAVLTINGRRFIVSGGGYDGFRWLALPLGEAIEGNSYGMTLERHTAGKPAFLAAVRVGSEKAVDGQLEVRSHNPSESFPEMREIWDREPSAPSEAERNARLAAEAFFRCRKYVEGWLAHADPKTGLIPRNLKGHNYWNGRDAAADNYPFMVLTAAMTDRPLFEGRMLQMLCTETKLTCRLDRLPDDWDFGKQGWRRQNVDLDALIFEGAEYVKDGLLPITEWLGPSPWSERMIGIIDDIWKNARIDTPFGKIPTLNFEVNGDLLQACSRLFWFTGQRKYLDWAIRLGDYYLLGNRHPTRDMTDLKLGDHSCEVINGLSELYVACAHAAPEKREAYLKPLHELYDRLLEIAVNQHGLFYLRVNPRTGEHSKELTDNWGYNYDGLYTVFLLDGKTTYRDAVRKVLGNLKAHYTGQGGLCQSYTADGYADSIEGAITLYNREPIASAADWIDAEIKTMWAKQQPSGIIEGWHGDGNFARTTLMYALWKTQGCRIEPWRPDVRIGAVRKGQRLIVSLTAERAWKGRLIFDRPRHKTNMRLPLDYPRINQFPEWFTVQDGKHYRVGDRSFSGKELAEGITVELEPDRELRLLVR
ncbi:MAG: hypothetical protein N3B01_07615 [Verrucomicrobiae bacterium]|nr:hypothetical protein [Verrucomicrobiae bacterium]